MGTIREARRLGHGCAGAGRHDCTSNGLHDDAKPLSLC